MISAAELTLAFVHRDLALAASGESLADRHRPGRFVAHGKALVFVYEVVAPDVVIVTTFPKE